MVIAAADVNSMAKSLSDTESKNFRLGRSRALWLSYAGRCRMTCLRVLLSPKGSSSFEKSSQRVGYHHGPTSHSRLVGDDQTSPAVRPAGV